MGTMVSGACEKLEKIEEHDPKHDFQSESKSSILFYIGCPKCFSQTIEVKAAIDYITYQIPFAIPNSTQKKIITRAHNADAIQPHFY